MDNKTIKIPLSRGLVSTINAEDRNIADEGKWYALKGDKAGEKFYAVRNVRRSGHRTRDYIHRLIANAKEGEYVDHIN